MSTSATHDVPSRLDGIQRAALVAGVVGAGVCLLGSLGDAGQFFRSYLVAFLFWMGLSIGSLSLLMIQHLTGGAWGVVIRRLLEAGSRTLPVVALLFVPLLFGLGELYVWSHAEAVAADPLLRHKSAYLNVPFFVARSAVYLGVWVLLASFLSKWSREQDEAPGPESYRRLRSLSGPGLVIMALTVTFASVDWAMSLDPHWFSTIYGVLFMIGPALSALSFVIVMLARLGVQKPLSDVLKPEQIHDLGKLLLAFVMLWAYVNFSQLLIVWSGNLPEETPWYVQRLHGGWQWLAVALVLFHFALPFLMLLSRDLKRSARLLGLVAGAILVARVIDLFWLIGPSLQGHGADAAHGLAIHWLDPVALVAVGGLWVTTFARQLRSRPLLPLGDPELQKLAAGPAEAGGH